ncbi:leucine-rich repeat domain-containing protein [Acidaminobacter sp. JC074]|uniref:leucine-rich repeat domain-containing protein n=1 Tax=Acidaminobacter sp. JC074 TaxID=2530199 RepID=UPI001F109102|nr:leucine-rich repeat domain-containing protein [Acidaminobacter sp. JC074]MCH4890777.1 leucine-rich repeat domain-containing protein [Acidaminobacter sp. JC074]
MKKILIFIFCLVLVGCSSSGQIKDAAIKREVDKLTNYENIPIEEITHLDVSFSGVESLEGIEVLKNLEYLTLSSNMIQDLRPLSGLENLKLVDIQNNRVTDLSPLKELANLEVLLIRNNPVESIDVLEPLFDHLKTTDFLVHVSFEDDNLEGLIRKSLNMPDEQMTYFDLKRLRSLDLRGSQVHDLSGIEHARLLDTLIVDGPVENLELIGQLGELKSLTIKNANLESVDFIKNLKGLTYLDLSYNQLKDISVIKDFDNLVYLDIKRNKISDVSPIQSTKLKSLFIEGNYISDYKDLKIIDQINETDIFIVYFSDGNLDAAVRKQVGKSQGVLTDRDLKSIRTLKAEDSNIESLEGIQLLENLIELDLSSNKIVDIRPLEDLKSLQVLKLKDNLVEDITSLIYLDQLSIADLSFNKITTVEALSYLPNLDYVYLEGNTIEDNALKDEIKSLLKGTDDW